MKTILHLIIALAVLVPASVMRAQSVPPLVNYQGRLSNPDGSPLPTADYELSFKIYNSATSNTGLVWGPHIFDGATNQGHGPKIPVVQGYFNVMLGPVDVNGVLLANAFNASNCFVEIAVSNHPPILPRQQFLTAPYAFQASTAAKLAGADWSAVFGTNDPVSGRIPGAKLANGAVTAQQIGTNQVWLATGNAGTAPGTHFLGTKDNQPLDFKVNGQNVMRLDTSGNVGIGTTTPTAKLHVAGSGYVTANPNDGCLEIGSGNDAISFIDFKGYANLINDYRGRLSYEDGVGFSFIPDGILRMCLTEWGNLGVGTASPGSRLQVAGGDIQIDSGRFLAYTPQDAFSYDSKTMAHYGLTWALDSWNGSRTTWISGYGGLKLFTMGSPRLSITGAGNVGVGTTAPEDLLHVNGNARVGYLTVTKQGGDEGGEITLKGGTEWSDFQLDVIQDNLRLRSGGTIAMHVKAGGRVGIGTANPSTRLEVSGTVTATAFNPPSDRNMKENVSPIDPVQVLERVAALPISRWNFKSDEGTKHVGPMAQDFYAAFGVGTDERHIATVDADGVALAAIQGLNQKLEERLREKDEEIERLRAKIARLETLEERLTQLERPRSLESEAR